MTRRLVAILGLLVSCGTAIAIGVSEVVAQQARRTTVADLYNQIDSWLGVSDVIQYVIDHDPQFKAARGKSFSYPIPKSLIGHPRNFRWQIKLIDLDAQLDEPPAPIPSEPEPLEEPKDAPPKPRPFKFFKLPAMEKSDVPQ